MDHLLGGGGGWERLCSDRGARNLKFGRSEMIKDMTLQKSTAKQSDVSNSARTNIDCSCANSKLKMY